MAYIFLDESGHFGKSDHEKHFVIGSFTVGEPKRTAKGFRKWCRGHFPKKMRTQSEIKWSATGIDDKLRLRTLRRISKLDVRIKFIYLLKKNIPAEYRDGDKFKDGLLYTNIIGDLLDMYLPDTDPEFRVFCDRRKLSGITDSYFKKIIKSRVSSKFSPKAIINIETVDSTTNANIQIADWISGALARYLEKGKLGDEFYAILKDNLIGEGKELFNTPIIDVEE